MKQQQLLHLEAEETVASWLLQDEENSYTAFAAGLRSEQLATPHYATIVEAVYRFVMEPNPEPFDLTSIHRYAQAVAKESKQKSAPPLSLLHQLAASDTRRAQAYLPVVRDWHLLRESDGLATWIRDVLQMAPQPDALLGELNARIDAIRDGVKADDTVMDGKQATEEYLRELDADIERVRTGSMKTYPWLWFSWDQHINELAEGFVGCIYALDGVGKSAYLENIAEYWAQQGLQVAFIHAENQRKYTLNRRATRLTGVPFRRINERTITDEERNEIWQASREPWTANMQYVYGASKDMETLCAEVRQLHREGKCDAVVLDYLQKVQFSRGTMSAFRGNTEGMEARNAELLKSMAADLKIPVMTASQMRKSATDSRIKTRQEVRGSGQISEKFQLAITLDRPLLSAEDAKIINNAHKLTHLVNVGDYSPLVTVRADKQNTGGTATFKQLYHGNRYLIEDWREP